MTKTQEIIAMIRDGKSDEEINKKFDCQKAFLTRCHTQAKKEIEAQAKAHQELVAPIQTTANVSRPQAIPLPPDMMDLFTKDTEVVKKIVAEAKGTQPQAIPLPPDMMDLFTKFLQQNVNAQATVQREERDTCHRHPKEKVKAGENCPHCVKASKLDCERERLNKFAPPCPKCQESRTFRYGGVIRKTRVQGNYVCGNCEISYNLKGESADWGKETKGV
jgi:hypothetical protein